MQFAVTEEERGLVAAAERFGSERLSPGERAHERRRGYPDDLAAEYRSLGFDRMGEPEAAGGADLPLGVRTAVWAKLAESDPGAPIGLSPAGPGSLGCPVDGPGAFVVADPITLDGGRARGCVPYVPASRLQWLVLVREGSLDVVTEGLETRGLADRPCGLRACGGVEVVLDSARCDRIGGGEEAQSALRTLRLFAASLLLGAARDAHACAARYAGERVAFGKPIAHHQGLAFQLADCATEVEAAALVLGAAASPVADHAAAAANAHAHVIDTALRVVERSVQVLGGHGYLHDHPVEKRMRDARTLASLWGGSARSAADAQRTILHLVDPLALGGAS